MAVKAIEATLLGDGSRADVLIQSDLATFPAQIEELSSASAREYVLRCAVEKGIKGQPGISRTSEPAHPINSDGEVIENLKDEKGNDLPPQHPRRQPAQYQARYEVTARQ